MVSLDSPFRRLPVDMPRQQVLFCDALRLSAEMAAFSYERLECLLKLLMDAAEGGNRGTRAVEGIVYAYGVIDAANRFREVLRVFPSLKQNEVFKLFIRATAAIEKLRDIIQDLNNELREISHIPAAALGTLTWLGPSPTEDSPPTAWMLQPGSTYHEQRTVGPWVDLLARLAPGKIAQVSLTTKEVRVDLGSDVVHRIRIMVGGLERFLHEYSQGKELLGSDQFFHFAFRPAEANETDLSPGTAPPSTTVVTIS